MTCWHFYPRCNDYDFKKANTVLIWDEFSSRLLLGRMKSVNWKIIFTGVVVLWEFGGQIPDHRTVKEIISVWWNPTCHLKKKFIWDLVNIFYCSGCLTSCVRSCCMDLSGLREDAVIFMSPIFRRHKLYIFIRPYKAGICCWVSLNNIYIKLWWGKFSFYHKGNLLRNFVFSTSN